LAVQQNVDMRRISAGAAILAIPTMIAGFYGMNFRHMPELEWPLGYPFSLALMVITAVGPYLYFKKRGWL
jgi:magnesium transporter